MWKKVWPQRETAPMPYGGVSLATWTAAGGSGLAGPICYPLRMEFRVEEQDGEIIVTDGVFTAAYTSPTS